MYFSSNDKSEFSLGIQLFKVNNESTTTMFEICSKLTIKTA